MKFLKQHAFFLIFIFIVSIMSLKLLYFDLNKTKQWVLSIVLSLNAMLIIIPQTWFWSENGMDYKRYKNIKYLDIVKKHPFRLIVQYMAILIDINAIGRTTHFFSIEGILISVVLIVIFTPIYLDYFTNFNLLDDY